ncbi:hypothetical protein PUN28_016163 [Cardiocondyla obscurior]|uniref:Uncharacterized protein n=1 Tax=Cardiocondyla obscurior TaxID=286306 RepID=A0AAW2EUY5_9HYME
MLLFKRPQLQALKKKKIIRPGSRQNRLAAVFFSRRRHRDLSRGGWRTITLHLRFHADASPVRPPPKLFACEFR